MFFTVVVTVQEKDQIFLPRVLTGLLNQTFRDFDLIIVIDGEAPLAAYDPNQICQKIMPAQVFYRPRSNTLGYRERNYALDVAESEYIVWLNVDNLVYPNWLQNHYDNTQRNPGAISVVNIQYWQRQNFWGVLPRALAYGEFDLLNYALPLELARKHLVFGPDTEKIVHADWLAFECCSRDAPVVWQRDQAVCACHF
jgi:glycosyltransferase involved in cell wall biosynthesis